MEVRIAPDDAAVGALAGATVARWLADGGSLGLAGGSTPRATYEALRHQPVPWSDVTLWMSDERWVAADHVDSNTAMARASLADHVSAELLDIPGVGDGEPAAAAAAYAKTLRQRVGDAPGVVLLGIGDDGHTASLFPGSDALGERDDIYVANYVESMSTWRLTATLPYLWGATQLGFIAVGTAKAEVVAKIIGGDSDYPAATAAAGAASATWFLDEAAAAGL